MVNVALFIVGELIVLGIVVRIVWWMAERQKQDAAGPERQEMTEFSSQQDD